MMQIFKSLLVLLLRLNICRFTRKRSLLLTALALILAMGRALYAAEFVCQGGVGGITQLSIAGVCLAEAINQANNNGEANTIILTSGGYLFQNVEFPSITGFFPVTITGEETTSMISIGNRAPVVGSIFFIAQQASLRLDGLTISGPTHTLDGIQNEGTLDVINSRIVNVGVGISNSGVANVTNSTIQFSGVDQNRNEGHGIVNSGFMKIANSTISNNPSSTPTPGLFFNGNGGGIFNTGTLRIVNTTIARNGIPKECGVSIVCTVGEVEGGGIYNLGTLNIVNSTIGENRGTSGGGIANFGTAELQNTILALNTSTLGPDCAGNVGSVGNNIIGDPTGCAVNPQPTDIIGDPGLGPLTDVVLIREGAPGTGRFPVLEKSPAIDHGNNEVCSSDPMLVTDQLGQPRSVAGKLDGPRVCDIGAVEFFPVVNNLVQLREVFTRYDRTPRPPWAPEEPDAGTFVITAKFENISNQIIFYPFFEVISIEGVINPPPQLLNTGRAPGTVGARMTPEGSLTTPLEPGETGIFQFVIGLQLPLPFTFFVDMLGEPRTTSNSVSMLGKAQTSNP